jgi:hypothetical protein
LVVYSEDIRSPFFCFSAGVFEQFSAPFQVILGGLDGLTIQPAPANIGDPPTCCPAIGPIGARLCHYDEPVMFQLAEPNTDCALTGAKLLGRVARGQEDFSVIVAVKAQGPDQGDIEQACPHAHLSPCGRVHYFPAYRRPLPGDSSLILVPPAHDATFCCAFA